MGAKDAAQDREPSPRKRARHRARPKRPRMRSLPWWLICGARAVRPRSRPRLHGGAEAGRARQSRCQRGASGRALDGTPPKVAMAASMGWRRRKRRRLKRNSCRCCRCMRITEIRISVDVRSRQSRLCLCLQSSSATVVPLLIGALGDASSEVRAVAAGPWWPAREVRGTGADQAAPAQRPGCAAALGQVGGTIPPCSVRDDRQRARS